MNNPKITVSVVAYNNDLKVLQKCIDSVMGSIPDTFLYVVDNSQVDRISQLCKGENVQYIFNGGNVGFSAGHNIGIRAALPKGARYHLILNPDVYFNETVLGKLTDFMDSNDDVGIVMPKILYPDGQVQHLCKLLPRPIDLFARRFLPKPLLGSSSNDRYELRFTGYDKMMDVPHLSGCFMLIRTAAIEKCGNFDESFFLYLEDVDFCRRITPFYRTVYYPQACAYHFYEKASYNNFKQLCYHIVSAIKYFNKWGFLFDKTRDEINREAIKKIKDTYGEVPA